MSYTHSTTGGFGGLSPTKKIPSSQNRYMKHYKQVEHSSNFGMSIPLQKRKAPYQRLSGDNSAHVPSKLKKLFIQINSNKLPSF